MVVVFYPKRCVLEWPTTVRCVFAWKEFQDFVELVRRGMDIRVWCGGKKWQLVSPLIENQWSPSSEEVLVEITCGEVVDVRIPRIPMWVDKT
jgi:hypothetical protein